MTTPSDATALARCPFCGSAASLEVNFGREWWVQCTSLADCGAGDVRLFGDPASAIAAWNRRPSEPTATAGGWISVDERLPELSGEVLAWIPFQHGSGMRQIVTYWWTEDSDGKVWQDPNDGPLAACYQPTHWQPLPNPPESL